MNNYSIDWKRHAFHHLLQAKDYYIDKISGAYNEVAQGERVAIFNENGFLEIAINRGATEARGGAEQLFGLRIGDMIRIEFTPQGSRATIDLTFLIMITRIVKLEFQSERIEEFLTFFETIKHVVNNFPGCYGMKLYRDVDQPTIVMTYSHWENEDALNEYRKVW